MRAFARKLAIAVTGAALWATLAGCAPEKANARPAPTASADTAFAMTIGEKAFHAEVAVSDLERAKGLMFRTALAPDTGMLFVFERPVRQSFWMKNTQVPLDIGFFTRDGILHEVRQLHPFVLDAVESARDDIAFCLEMQQGWFAQNGVKAGQRLDMTAVRKAIEARGAMPFKP